MKPSCNSMMCRTPQAASCKEIGHSSKRVGCVTGMLISANTSIQTAKQRVHIAGISTEVRTEMIFTVELRLGIACPPKPGRIPLTKTKEISLLRLSRNRERFRPRWFPLRKISTPTLAAFGVAGPGRSSMEGEKADTAEYLDNELSKLLYVGSDPVRQIVILTDKTDTRPFRLTWPSPSVIFAVAPVQATDAALKEVAASGLKAKKHLLVQYISEDFAADENDNEDWGEKLLRVGYRGDRPSVWLLEMQNDLFQGYLQKILPVASSLLMKDSAFIGVIPASSSSEVETQEQLRKLFASHGFLAELRTFGTPESLDEKEGEETHVRSLFVTFYTRQLRLSDPQVEYARMQIMAAEEEGDEEGFIDAW
ncbi:hypothetical protein R1flu_001445 [Riccia fluitans]|uniref:Uncharacterized protein n=1 Tax=Riccia fluitans TaxID=41844 RepID=A0ABD1Y397_9MARC